MYIHRFILYTILYKAHRGGVILELTLGSMSAYLHNCLFASIAWKTMPGRYTTRKISRKSRMYSGI